MDQLADDERGVSESTGIAILIGMTIVVTATVGLNVLVVDEADAGPPTANFTYDYVQQSSALVITHARGDEFPAGELLIEGPDSEVTWATAARVNESTTVGPGDIVQISEGNAYGERVSNAKTIRIYHATGGNRTQLSRWPEQG